MSVFNGCRVLVWDDGGDGGHTPMARYLMPPICICEKVVISSVLYHNLKNKMTE